MSISGIKKLTKQLNQLADINKKNAVLQESAEVVLITAKEYVPVDTGVLRNSIQLRQSRNRIVIGTNVEYALWNEFYNPTNKRYMTNAILHNKEFVKYSITNYIKKEIRKL